MVSLAGPPPPIVIPRGAPDDPAYNFDMLKAEAIAWVQQLAGKGWTDYNAHDPGVTILEQLCYALTDLAYRADFSIADLLAGPGGAIARSRFGPHAAWRALPGPPVTVLDFRRLLLDRVRGLGNVWLKPREIGSGSADGLYDIRIQPETPLPGIHVKGRPRHARLAARVRRMFLRHRPLCEDIGSARVLRPLRTRVGATVHLQPGARPEEVMAEAIYRLALTFAPEPRRRDLASVAPGTAAADLFEGPLARNGLLAPGALGKKPAEITLDMLSERLSDIPGVLGARDLWLWVKGAGDCGEGYVVDDDHVCSLDAGIADDDFPLVLTSDGQPCAVDRDEVVRRLERMWDLHRRRPRLKAAYHQEFPMPQGRPRQVTDFAALAGQFPRVYGLGDGNTSPAGAAQGQLLGFLAIFEMLMVDYCDRLGDVRALMAGRPGSDARLDSAAFLDRIPALRHLAVPPTDEDDDVFARLRMAPAQRERLLDFLLALYGEDAGEVPLPPPIRPGSQAASRYRIGVKHALLGHLATLARRRGRGFDYRARSGLRRLAGVELRTRILLGDLEPAEGRRSRRRGLAFVEHMMLRPRTGERARLDDFRYGLAVSAVVRLPRAAAGDGHYRRQLVASIRAAVPAHIGLHVHFVDRRSWRRFRRLHGLWSLALEMEQTDAADLLSIELRDMLTALSESGT
jgi:hypothetical protein